MKAMISVVLLLLFGCGDDGLNDRFMRAGKYISENCPHSMAYDSIPAQYVRALEVSRDSAENLVVKLEEYIRLGKCPE